MKNLLPAFALVCSPAMGQNTHTIFASDFQFDPLVLTITQGDTVRLSLGAGHTFTEITADAWALNVTTPAIGYDFGPFGELNTEHYIVLNAAPDTLYYICIPHADMGMKGRIIIQEGTIGMDGLQRETVRIFPNPTNGTLWISPMIPGIIAARVTDMAGRLMELPITGDGRLETGQLADGLYHASFRNAQGEELARQTFTVVR